MLIGVSEDWAGRKTNRKSPRKNKQKTERKTPKTTTKMNTPKQTYKSLKIKGKEDKNRPPQPLTKPLKIKNIIPQAGQKEGAKKYTANGGTGKRQAEQTDKTPAENQPLNL